MRLLILHFLFLVGSSRGSFGWLSVGWLGRNESGSKAFLLLESVGPFKALSSALFELSFELLEFD